MCAWYVPLRIVDSKEFVIGDVDAFIDSVENGFQVHAWLELAVDAHEKHFGDDNGG